MPDALLTPEDVATPIDALNHREKRFVHSYLADGRFCLSAAVAYAYPDVPPERRATVGNRVRSRPHVRAAIAYLCDQSVASLRERIEYTLARSLSLQAFFNPLDIIDKQGFLRPEIDRDNLGEMATLIQSIDAKTGTVKFVDRQKALGQLMTLMGYAREAPPPRGDTVENHLHVGEMTPAVAELLAKIINGGSQSEPKGSESIVQAIIGTSAEGGVDP
jgi:hypothetical protein